MRNEHAYYSCISQVPAIVSVTELIHSSNNRSWACCRIPFKPTPQAKVCTCDAQCHLTSFADVVYVCGDSHCLSSAWQTITIPVGFASKTVSEADSAVQSKAKPILLTPK